MAIAPRSFLRTFFPDAANLATAPTGVDFEAWPPGVGIDLGIEHQDVDVFAGSKDMVEVPVADIVGPAVAAEDPDRSLDQVLFQDEEFFR